MIKVFNVEYDNEAKEADVELLSDDVSIKCYCHPLDNLKELNQLIHNELIAFNVNNVMAVDKAYVPAAIKTDESYYSYNLVGIVVDKTKIKINDFIIDIGYIPKDIGVGSIISCDCLRIDIY